MGIRRLSSNLGAIVIVLLVLAVIAGLAYGGFRVHRWWNYKFGYSSQVKADIQAETEPLRKEVEALKRRVEALENKK